MEGNHTPGPWRTGDVFNTVFGPMNGNASPQTIAHMSATNVADKRANARLIATAPEMYEALKAAWKLLDTDGCRDGYRGHDSYDDIVEQVEASLSKASGKAVQP